MTEKFNRIEYESLSNDEIHEINGGFPLLVMALVAADLAAFGYVLYSAYQKGYNDACGCE